MSYTQLRAGVEVWTLLFEKGFTVLGRPQRLLRNLAWGRVRGGFDAVGDYGNFGGNSQNQIATL